MTANLHFTENHNKGELRELQYIRDCSEINSCSTVRSWQKIYSIIHQTIILSRKGWQLKYYTTWPSSQNLWTITVACSWSQCCSSSSVWNLNCMVHAFCLQLWLIWHSSFEVGYKSSPSRTHLPRIFSSSLTPSASVWSSSYACCTTRTPSSQTSKR